MPLQISSYDAVRNSWLYEGHRVFIHVSELLLQISVEFRVDITSDTVTALLYRNPRRRTTARKEIEDC